MRITIPLLALSLTCATGCYSWVAIQPQELATAPEPATVRVTLGRGDVVVLEQAALYGDTLVGRETTGERTGRNAEGQRVRQTLFRVLRVPFSEIAELELRRFDTGKTIGRSIAVGIPLAVVLATLIGEILDRPASGF
ncbi:MAG: hypothetical protein KatS3mg081_0279 [Gemmatimonadales bacterium]|nr:MAG: hypothetical protein KatS3mg081_0279 [Gemmatimonadales bacterium]